MCVARLTKVAQSLDLGPVHRQEEHRGRNEVSDRANVDSEPDAATLSRALLFSSRQRPHAIRLAGLRDCLAAPFGFSFRPAISQEPSFPRPPNVSRPPSATSHRKHTPVEVLTEVSRKYGFSNLVDVPTTVCSSQSMTFCVCNKNEKVRAIRAPPEREIRNVRDLPYLNLRTLFVGSILISHCIWMATVLARSGRKGRASLHLVSLQVMWWRSQHW